MTNRTGFTIRLTREDRYVVEALKTYLQEPKSSQALMTAARLYPAQHQALQNTLDELKRSRDDLQQLLQAIATVEQARLDLISVAAEIACRDNTV